MKISPLDPEIEDYLEKRRLRGKFDKQKKIFEENPFHPSLNTELMEPKMMKIWSFRVDKKYRALFIFRNRETVEVLEVNNHYK